MSAQRILGLDPATLCGWAFSVGNQPCLQYGTWALKVKDDEHPGRKHERLRRYIFSLHQEQRLNLIAAEDAVLGSKFFTTQGSHSELKGVIKLVCAELEIPLLLVNPMTLKKWLTGHGRAEKHHMIDAIRLRFNIVTTDDNVADAIAVMEYAKSTTKEKEIQNDLFEKSATKKRKRN